MLVTKTDLAEAVGFDEAAFRANVGQVNPGVEILLTSARTGNGTGLLLEAALAVHGGRPVHVPVMARVEPTHTHGHDHGHGHAHPALHL